MFFMSLYYHAIFYPLANWQKIPITLLNFFPPIVFSRTYHRGRRLAVLRSVNDSVTLKRQMWMNNVKLLFVILHLLLKIVKFGYGILGWIIPIFNTWNVYFLPFVQIKRLLIFNVRFVNLQNTIVLNFLNPTTNHPSRLLWFIVIYRALLVFLIVPTQNGLLLLLMIILVFVGFTRWKKKMRFVLYLSISIPWFKHNSKQKSKFCILIMTQNILIIFWAIIFKNMGSFIKVHVSTPLNKMRLSNEKIDIFSK